MRAGRGNVTLFVLSIVASLVMAEVFLRVFMPQQFLPHPSGMYINDADLGYALNPGFEGVFIRSEFETPVIVGKSGFRAPEPRQRKDNTFRILCLGDSFTFGQGVGNEQAWPYLLEEELKKKFLKLDIQVVNAGVPGYGTDEELEVLRLRGPKYRPDLVVTQFFAGNDFGDNRSLARESYEVRNGMLYGTSSDRPWWIQANHWLKSYSHLYTIISERLGYVAMRLGLYEKIDRSLSEYFTEDDARATTNLLVQIGETAKELGADTLFVFVPDKAKVFSDMYQPSRAANVVQAAAKQANVPWIDLTSELMRRDDRLDLYYSEDSHWTPLGHQVVAQIFSKWIAEHGLNGMN